MSPRPISLQLPTKSWRLVWRALVAYGKESTPPILTLQGVNHRYAVQMEGERKKMTSSVKYSRLRQRSPHHTSRFSSVFNQKHMASRTLKQTRHSQLMCFGLMWQLVTLKHWQRADTAESMFYVCKLGQKNNTDFLSSPPKVPVTFSSIAVCNYAA